MGRPRAAVFPHEPIHSTPMAEGVYADVGFRDLGRFLEYLP